jgi:hypothetical protein
MRYTSLYNTLLYAIYFSLQYISLCNMLQYTSLCNILLYPTHELFKGLELPQTHFP